MRKILHIGLGKTGTTTFQHSMLPRLIKSGILTPPKRNAFQQLKLLELATYSDRVKRPHISWPCDSGVCLLSYEGLVGHPSRWRHNFEVIASTIEADVEILVSFRDPIDWLRSNYLQAVAMGLVIEPSKFLVHSKSAIAKRDKHRNIPKTFSPDLVNYSSLISLYSQHFQTVRAVPMQTFFAQDAFCAALELETTTTTAREITDPNAARWNVSYSKEAIALTQWRERLLNKIGLRSLSYVDELEAAIKKVIPTQDSEAQMKYKKIRERSVLYYQLYLALRCVSQWKRFIEWRWIMQSLLPLIYPTTPYTLELDIKAEYPGLIESQDFASMLQLRGSITNHELDKESEL